MRYNNLSASHCRPPLLLGAVKLLDLSRYSLKELAFVELSHDYYSMAIGLKLLLVVEDNTASV